MGPLSTLNHIGSLPNLRSSKCTVGNGLMTTLVRWLVLIYSIRAYMREHGGVDREPAEIVEMLLDRVVAQLRAEIPWRPGARELLAAVNGADIPTALVTMSWKRFADQVVECLPSGSFRVSVTGDEVTRGKPHPEPYLLAAERLGVDPRHCVAIEDSPTGVRSALAAGCRVLGVPHVVGIPRDLDQGSGQLVIASSLVDTSLSDLVW